MIDNPDLTVLNFMENSFGPRRVKWCKLTICIKNHEMGTYTNSVDPDEMTHYSSFHQGSHCMWG